MNTREPERLGRFTVNAARASLDLEQPVSDVVVPIGVERLALDATYGGQPLEQVVVPAPDGVVRAAAIADAVAAMHAWALWRAFLTASVGSHEDGEAWALLLRELWGDEGSAPAPPPPPAAPSWLVVEVSRPLPEPARDRSQLIVATVGGATLGTLALAPARRPVAAHELRRRIEALGGFELCRLAVREGLIGRPLRSGADLRTRLRAVADAREALPHDVADASSPLGITLAPGWQRHAAQALDGEAAGFVIARRRQAVVGLSGSRVAVLPRAAARELLASAGTAGDVVVSIGEPGEDAAVVYAPDVVWSEAGAPAGDAAAEPRTSVRARRPAAALRRRLPSRDGGGELTGRLPILMYHRVAPSGGDALRKWRVTPSQLEAQLHHLREAGFHGASFDEWRSAAERHAPLPGRRVMITFDDGYEDFAEHAHPLLRQYELDATVFLVSDLVGGANEWDREHGEVLPLMDWETIRALDGRGVSFGGHTASHPRLTTLSPADVARETSRCRATLAERLGHPVTAFSYPYGDVDPAVSHLVGACGFSYAVTTRESRAASAGSMLELPRLTVLGTESHDAFVRMLASDD